MLCDLIGLDSAIVDLSFDELTGEWLSFFRKKQILCCVVVGSLYCPSPYCPWMLGLESVGSCLRVNCTSGTEGVSRGSHYWSGKGPDFGKCACFSLGDVGYVCDSGAVYYWWAQGPVALCYGAGLSLRSELGYCCVGYASSKECEGST